MVSISIHTKSGVWCMPVLEKNLSFGRSLTLHLADIKTFIWPIL